MLHKLQVEHHCSQKSTRKPPLQQHLKCNHGFFRRLSERLLSLLYLNSFPLIVFMSGSPFIGADHFPLPLFGLEPEELDAEVSFLLELQCKSTLQYSKYLQDHIFDSQYEYYP